MTLPDANTLGGMVPVCCLYHLRGNKHPGCWEHIFGALTHFIDLGTYRPSFGSISISRKKFLFCQRCSKIFWERLSCVVSIKKACNKKFESNTYTGLHWHSGKGTEHLNSRLCFTLRSYGQLYNVVDFAVNVTRSLGHDGKTSK